MSVLADASPLIALGQIDHIELLRRLFRVVEISAAIHREIGPTPVFSASEPNWLQLTAIDPATAQPLPANLGPGEAKAIALAR